MNRLRNWPGELWLYGRARGLWLVTLIGGPVIVVASALLPRSAPVLFADSQTRIRVPAVIALLAVIALGPTLAREVGEAEWIRRGRLRVDRTAHLVIACVLLAAVAMAVASSIAPNRLSTEVFLNGIALVGVAAATVRLTPLPSWLLVLVLVGAVYVVGTNPDTGAPLAWAWLLWTDHLALKAVINLLVFAAGATAFVMLPGRWSAGAE